MSGARARTRRALSLGTRDPRDRRGTEIPLAAPLGVNGAGELTLTEGLEGDLLIMRSDGYEPFDGFPIRVTPNIKTAAYLARMGEFVRCNPTGGGFTVSLPSASGQAGKSIVVKNASASANTITIDAAGSETIDGSATATIAAAWGSRVLVSDGASWMVV